MFSHKNWCKIESSVWISQEPRSDGGGEERGRGLASPSGAAVDASGACRWKAPR